MRTAITNHDLLPKGLHLEYLSVEPGRVSISVSAQSSGRCHEPQSNPSLAASARASLARRTAVSTHSRKPNAYLLTMMDTYT